MAVGHVPAYLFAVLIASVCYGIAVTLFAQSVGTIVRKRRTAKNFNLSLMMPSVLIFIFATLNVLGIWIHMYMTFVVNGHDVVAYLNLIRSTPKTIIQTGLVGAILLTDALMVYRTFALWTYNANVIVIPCLTLVATFTSAVSFLRIQHETANVNTSVFEKSLTEWTVAFLLCSFATTVYSTGLISYKLMNNNMKLRKYGLSAGGSLSRRVTRIIVESAALYSLNHLLYAILYEMKTQVESTPSFMEASLASITCSLMIVRSEDAFNQPPTLPVSFGSYPATEPTELLAFESYSQHQNGKAFALRSTEVSVEVSQTVDEGV